MTDFAALLRPDRDEPATAIHLLDKSLLPDWMKRSAGQRRTLVEASGFEGRAGQVLVLPTAGDRFEVLAGVADASAVTP